MYACAIVLVFLLVYVVIINADNSTLDAIEQDVQSYFSNISTNGLNCYDMSEHAKKYFEDVYHFPVVFVHGEVTRNLRSLKHVWLMVKIEGDWHEFESTRLCFMDVSNDFELRYMTYDYE